jgi:hypothetical protein
VPNCAIASRNTDGASLRRRIGQTVEIEAVHGSGHVAAEPLGLKTHGVAPDTQDNLRADAMNLKRGSR